MLEGDIGMPDVAGIQEVQDRPCDARRSADGRGLGDDHPLNDVIGSMEGDEWEKVLRNIKRNREEVDRTYREQHADEA